MLTLWDYLLALLVLAGTGTLVWLIVGPTDRGWLPEELRAADAPGITADSDAAGSGHHRLSA